MGSHKDMAWIAAHFMSRIQRQMGEFCEYAQFNGRLNMNDLLELFVVNSCVGVKEGKIGLKQNDAVCIIYTRCSAWMGWSLFDFIRLCKTYLPYDGGVSGVYDLWFVGAHQKP